MFHCGGKKDLFHTAHFPLQIQTLKKLSTFSFNIFIHLIMETLAPHYPAEGKSEFIPAALSLQTHEFWSASFLLHSHWHYTHQKSTRSTKANCEIHPTQCQCLLCSGPHLSPFTAILLERNRNFYITVQFLFGR